MAYVKQSTIHKTIHKAIEYIENEKKTDDKTLVSSNLCSTDLKLCIKEMMMLKESHAKKDGIQGFHFIQSFKHGEVSREEAHKIGQEWAAKFLDSNYQYVLSTHIDKNHTHNHIICNSVGLDGKKFNSCTNQLNDIRIYSDLVCKEHNLSVIVPNQKNRSKSYKEILENKDKNSWKDEYRVDIDLAVSTSNSFEEFIQKMKDEGYHIRQGNIKYISFTKASVNKTVRGKTLGEEYSEQEINKRIKLNAVGIKKLKSKTSKYYTCNSNTWRKEIQKLAHKRSSLETNILLVMLLFKIIFNNNKESELKIKRPVKYSYSRKVTLKSINDLSNKMNLINKYDLKKRSDVTNAIVNLKNKCIADEVKAKEIKSYEIKLSAVCIEIDMYKKYKKYFSEYQKSIFKSKYKQSHEYELEKFNNCITRLENFGLKNESEYDAFQQNRDIVLQSLEEVNNSIVNSYSELFELENLQKYLNADSREDVIKESKLEYVKNSKLDKER